MQATFERDGFVVVRDVVDSDELARLHDAFTRWIPEHSGLPGPTGTMHEIAGVSLGDAELRRFALDPRFGALAARALGAQRIQLLQDSLLYKPAVDGASVEWHQDHTYVGFLVPARVVTLRVALVPEDEHNGCMRVVGGSHAWGPIGANQALRADRVASLVDELAPAQRAELETAEHLALAPGDVSIHHCLALHGSGKNHSERPRRTIILRLFDAACRLDATRLPEAVRHYFPTDEAGHLAEHAFPCVYGGT